MRRVRGGDIGMVFQEPMTSLNPVLDDRRQITETLEQHRGMDRARRLTGAPSSCWASSALPMPIGTARAVPASIVRRHAPAHHDRDRAGLRSQDDHRRRADTALDVTIQAQILN